MRTNKITIFIISFLLVCVASPILAQQPDNLNKQVQVTRAYDPIISDANKIDMDIKMADSLTSIKKEYQYSILSRGISSSYAIQPIPAAKINGSAYNEPAFLYARLGIGYPLSPLADLYINNYNPSGLSVGGFYNFRSLLGEMSNSNSKGADVPYDEMSHNAGLFFKKHFDNFTIGVDGGFNQHRVLFYGYDAGIHDSTNFTYRFNNDSLRQVYNAFNIKLDIQSNDNDPDMLRYKGNLWYKWFGDQGKDAFDLGRMFAQSESTIGGELYLGKQIGENHLFNIDADFNFFNNKLNYNEAYNQYRPQDLSNLYSLYKTYYGDRVGKDSTDKRYELTINPSYQYTNDKIELLVGFKLDAHKEKGENGMHIYPQARFSYLLSNEFVPYASIDGGHVQNTYQNIAEENPYILPGMTFNMVNSVHAYHVRIGAKGNIQKAFTYNIYGAYCLNKDMYFYRNADQPLFADTVAGHAQYRLYNNFEVQVDEVQEWQAGVELAANFSAVNMSLKANFNHYILDDNNVVKAPYHRPMFTLNFATNVTVARYLLLSASLYTQTQSAYNYDEVSGKTFYNDGFFDIGLGAEYLVTNNFSVFANVNNLLNTKYMVWNNYRVPGIHVEGGITFKF